MSLKQHNEIVEALLKQLTSREQEIATLKKQLEKASAPQTTSPNFMIEKEKEYSKKLALIHKDYKEKIENLNQQLKAKSNENDDLKTKLAFKKNQELKEKEYVNEIVKKSSNIAQYDPKVAALVSHYEMQLQKKQSTIENLKDELKMIQLKPSAQNPESPPENSYSQNSQQTHTKYQKEISELKSQLQKSNSLLSEKEKQTNSIMKKYSELTKDYYKIINEYNIDENTLKTNKKIHQNSTQFQRHERNSEDLDYEDTPVFNPHKINERNKDKDNDKDKDDESELSYSFLSNLEILGNKTHNVENDEKKELEFLNNLIENIMEHLKLNNRLQILPTIIKICSKNEENVIYENVCKYTQSFMYRIGMGKIGASEVIEHFEIFEKKLEKYVESSELVDEVCIEIGAKRDKVLEKIKDLKATQDQFFSNMKDIDFMKKLPKANKIVEFIEYFELEAEICELPEQLKKIYEQLKYVDRFIKQAFAILGREPLGLEKSFETILRYLERKQAEQELQNERSQRNPKKQEKN